MGKSSNDQPAAPNPADTAAAQGAANKDTAVAQQQLNLIDQTTPYGSITYNPVGSKTPEGIQRYNATQTLSPEQQAILNESQKASLTYGQTGNTLLGNVKDMLSQPFSLDSLGALPTASEGLRTTTRDNILARLQPQYDQDLDKLKTTLANQGITEGSAAWNSSMDTYNRALNDARIAADLSAGSEMYNLLGSQLASRNQGINELYMPRQTALNETAALATGAQVTNPTYVSTPQTGIANTDVIGPTMAAYQGALNNYNQGIASKNALMGGLFGTASALGGGYMANPKFW